MKFWQDSGSPFESSATVVNPSWLSAAVLDKAAVIHKLVSVTFQAYSEQVFDTQRTFLADLVKLWEIFSLEDITSSCIYLNISLFFLFTRKAIHQPKPQKWTSDGGNCWPEVIQITSKCVRLPHTWNPMVRWDSLVHSLNIMVDFHKHNYPHTSDEFRGSATHLLGNLYWSSRALTFVLCPGIKMENW